MPRLLDFFIIGVQKGGTTALDSYLKKSALVQTAAAREVHFFDNEEIDWGNPEYQLLTNHFDWTVNPPIQRGESTPIYIYWPNALERLHKYNPKAKLIICLRHPAFRAHSHWRMETKRGTETLTFEEAISEFGRSRVRKAKGGVHRVYSYVERGFYGDQIVRLRRLFPSHQLLFLRTDEIWKNPYQTMVVVHQFLGIAPPGAIESGYIVPIETAKPWLYFRLGAKCSQYALRGRHQRDGTISCAFACGLACHRLSRADVVKSGLLNFGNEAKYFVHRRRRP